MSKIFFILAVLVLALGISADDRLCVPLTSNIGPPLPTLPNQFRATIESNFRLKEANYTEEYEQYYDYVNNRAATVKFGEFKQTTILYLFDTDELIINAGTDCKVEKLVTSDQNQFGFWMVNSSSFHIDPPSYILSAGFNASTEFVGSDVSRGINVRKWQGCSFLPDENITFKITWAFADPSVWITPISIGGSSIEYLVEMVIETKSKEINTEARYHYTTYRPYLTGETFNTPKGVYCPGRAKTKPLPKVPSHFSYRVEANFADLSETTTQAEWYDFENNLARIDYVPLATQQDISLIDNDKITEIHDFSSGVRYVLNLQKEECLNVTTLDPKAIYANVTVNASSVRIPTAVEMFNFDKVDYQYHGTQKIREIDCDVWIALKSEWSSESGSNINSTWEWYFMSQNWTAINSARQQINTPIQLIITKYIPFEPVFLSSTTIYNYFDFKQEKPDLFSFNIESCFSGQASQHLRLTLEGITSALISDKHEFKYQLLNKIANVSNVLPTRINRVELDFNEGSTDVLFKLLDKPPVFGNVKNTVSQASLKESYYLLKKYVENGGEFKFNIKNKEFSASNAILTSLASSTSTTSLITTPTVYSEQPNYDEKQHSSEIFKNKMVIGSIVISLAVGLALGGLAVLVIIRTRMRRGEQPPLSMSGLMNIDSDVTH